MGNLGGILRDFFSDAQNKVSKISGKISEHLGKSKWGFTKVLKFPFDRLAAVVILVSGSQEGVCGSRASRFAPVSEKIGQNFRLQSGLFGPNWSLFRAFWGPFRG